ncbi:hypothetical protein [Ectobacillus ponti]|uniref:Uncharacterized protein n=1 Tax=Ectobacillus ponti TaxID=2961894 RepID=A0AA42BPL0_9BACI|nr:hypothetical protein [Ectobacillus ponti]MCP8969235.1 hypothetical protein [Ectobacillus ponti]
MTSAVPAAGLILLLLLLIMLMDFIQGYRFADSVQAVLDMWRGLDGEDALAFFFYACVCFLSVKTYKRKQERAQE